MAAAAEEEGGEEVAVVAVDAMGWVAAADRAMWAVTPPLCSAKLSALEACLCLQMAGSSSQRRIQRAKGQPLTGDSAIVT